MLAEAMTALASAGGSAVVQAAGTDAWETFRQRLAKFFARGDPEREHAELDRLDQAAELLKAAEAGEVEQIRIRQEASWQARLEVLLERLDETEREHAAGQLREILSEQIKRSRAASTGPGGLAAGGNVDIRANTNSIASGVIHGNASVGSHPTRPDPSQG